MKQFRFSLLVFLFSVGVFSASTVLHAQQVLVGTVNIENAKIISQEGNTFRLSFVISNREGVQAGIRYGVRLYTQGAQARAVDQKVYDEVLTLGEHSKIEREIAYTAPANLDGKYMMYVENQNERGFPFGIGSFGEVTLTATAKGVELQPDTCYLTVQGEASGTKYGIRQGVDIDSSESLSLHCQAVNTTDTTVTVAPSFETHTRSNFGDTVSAAGGDTAPLIFAKGETKNVTLALPKATAADFYKLIVTLSSPGGASSNIDVHYIVRGPHASIQNVSLDKESYIKGETATVSLVWVQAAGQYVRSSAPALSMLVAKVELRRQGGGKCADPVSYGLKREAGSPVAQIAVPITSDCPNPKVTVSIEDPRGEVFDSTNLDFVTDRKGIAPWVPIVAISAIIVGIVVYAGIKRRKTPTVTDTTI